MAFKFLVHIYGHVNPALVGLPLASSSLIDSYRLARHGYHILDADTLETECKEPESNLIILEYWSTFNRNDNPSIPGATLKHSDLASRIIAKIGQYTGPNYNAEDIEMYITGHSIGGVAAIFLGKAAVEKKFKIKYFLLLDAAFQKYVPPDKRDPKGEYEITKEEETIDLMSSVGFIPSIGHNYFQDYEGTPKDAGIEETHGDVTPGFTNHNVTTSVNKDDPHIGAIRFGFAEQYGVIHSLLKDSLKESILCKIPPVQIDYF